MCVCDYGMKGELAAWCPGRIAATMATRRCGYPAIGGFG
jgi:hypothetical protein